MDQFVQKTTGGGCTQTTFPDPGNYGPNGIVMDYYDGNTVTALWNYAQHFALNDNSYGTQFGPSTPGALNLVCGQTNGASIDPDGGPTSRGRRRDDERRRRSGTVINDQDPCYDECSRHAGQRRPRR